MSSEGATGTMFHDETGEKFHFSTQIESDGSFLLPVQGLETGLWHVKLDVPTTSSEGKRWTMRYRRFEDDTSAIPYVADGPEIDAESIEVVPASEVERLQERPDAEFFGRVRDERDKAESEVERLREALLAYFLGRYTERFPDRAATISFLAEFCEVALADDEKED